jgi:AAA15 family ATPase/GTPase
VLVDDLEGETVAKINTVHKKFDEDGNQIGFRDFELRSQESSGTNKVIDISGPIFDTMLEGGVLVIDELDAKLHPLMTAAITNLFNSPEYNTNNAQLIFATHDTNLLSYGRFRRDQIYFIEKDKYEASDLYSLIEYKEDNAKIRKDRSFEKDYITGRYGAIPFIGNFGNLLANG